MPVVTQELKRHNQAKIIKNQYFYFSFLTWAVRREHVGIQVFLNFGLLWQRSKCDERPIYEYFHISYFGHACSKLNFVLISRITGKCATQSFKNFRNSSLWICSYFMVILRNQNKNTYFLNIFLLILGAFHTHCRIKSKFPNHLGEQHL